MSVRVLIGDACDKLADLPDGSVHCCVTSPPYFGLRDYCVAGQIGLEASPAAYIAELVSVFREVRRVLRDDGTLWLNLGDSYCSTDKWGGGRSGNSGKHTVSENGGVPSWACRTKRAAFDGIKPKDLLMIPARVALALQADGWWLRSDIIWCLSGGTRVYARTRKGEMPMTIKDMVRLDPATVQLWNGEKWTQVRGWNETPRPDRTYEIELRSGQRIGCTAGHLWPTQRGNVRADQLIVGDVIRQCQLPEPASPKMPAALDDEMVGWFVGLYIAEGSQSDGTIQIASHTREEERFARLRAIASAFHGTAAIHKTSPNGCTVALNGPALLGILNTYISGRIASDKHLHPRCWHRSNAFLRAVLDGYLAGDGHHDIANNRWRIAFCNNDELVADLRTICARLGISVRLRRHVHTFNGDEFPGYRGELRFSRSAHHNSRDDGEVVAIRESRARKFWDIGVADEPHLFALASGVLTHNSKPNPMPESVTDRPTSAHEHVFLLAKAERYYFDAEAVKEGASGRSCGNVSYKYDGIPGHETKQGILAVADVEWHTRNIRNVWTIATAPYSEAHFATFPPALVEPCIKAGCPEGGTVLDCFGGAGTTALVADRLKRNAILIELSPAYAEMARRRIEDDGPLFADVAAE